MSIFAETSADITALCLGGVEIMLKCQCVCVIITGCSEVDDSGYARLSWMMLAVRLQSLVKLSGESGTELSLFVLYAEQLHLSIPLAGWTAELQ